MNSSNCTIKMKPVFVFVHDLPFTVCNPDTSRGFPARCVQSLCSERQLNQVNEFLNQPELISHWRVLNKSELGWEKNIKNVAPFYMMQTSKSNCEIPFFPPHCCNNKSIHLIWLKLSQNGRIMPQK